MNRRLLAATLLALCGLGVHAANINLPTFQLLTRGRIEDGSFPLDTRARVDIALGGGYKIGGEVVFTLSDDYLEGQLHVGSAYDQQLILDAFESTLRLDLAQVRVRDIFGLPIELRYFVGNTMRLLNGEVFPERFGTVPVASDVRGLLYFPTGVEYDGVHAINGTGLALSSAGGFDRSYLLASFYQDSILGAGIYSSDLYAAFNLDAFKIESFLGTTFPLGPYGGYRGGVLLFYDSGQTGEFLTQIGVTRWVPGSDDGLNIDDFFFLFEPRVHLGWLSILLTLFWHPEYYAQELTDERGSTDIIAKFVAGNALESVVSGGIESGITLRPVSGSQQFSAALSPFLRINSNGVLWDIKSRIKLFPFDWSDIVEVYLGIRTQF